MIDCIHGTLNQGASFLKSNRLACLLRRRLSGCHATPLPFGQALRDIPKDGCEGDYHLASAMDSQSRTKGTCIVFVAL